MDTGKAAAKGMHRTLLAASLVAVVGCDGVRFHWDEPTPVAAPTPSEDDAPDADGEPTPRGPVPFDGMVQVARRPPPPMLGGGLLLVGDERFLVVSDPVRDVVHLFDLHEQRAVDHLDLAPGAWPGRAAADADGQAHVVLRGEDAVVTLAVVEGALREIRREGTCPAPRGIAWDAVAERIHVACVDGHLDSFDPRTGERTRRLLLGADLRSVVPLPDGRLALTTFRRARVLVVDKEGAVLSEADVAPNAAAAWDAALIPGAGEDPVQTSMAIVHQLQTPATVHTSRGGYGGGRSAAAVPAVSTPTLTVWNVDDAQAVSSTATLAVLPVDLAVSLDELAMVDGSAGDVNVDRPSLVRSALRVEGDPFLGAGEPVVWTQQAATDAVVLTAAGPVIWSASAGALRDPEGATIRVTAAPELDTGFDLFHLATPSGVTCASCHPGGRDDGHVWTLLGPVRTAPPTRRRTQSLGGGIMATAPFHWDGEHRDLEPLLHDVMTGRMGAGDPTADQRAVLGNWLDALPAPPPPGGQDPAAVARGRALFHDPDVGCATCHGEDGADPDHGNWNVGTGRDFQPPLLTGLGARAPYLHDGCAETLEDRFDPACGGAWHGDVDDLTAHDITDLVAYLRSL